MIPATDENIELAKEFVWEKWKERSREMGHPEPEDLSSACKFASRVAEMVFGGRMRGNWQHQFAELDAAAGSSSFTSSAPAASRPAFRPVIPKAARLFRARSRSGCRKEFT